MKHFLVEIHYLVPVEQLAGILPDHRAFLLTGYERGLLLLSGPQEPRTGGIVVARSESLEEIQAFFANDPYCLAKVATHVYIEFNPVLHQSFLDDWIKG
jgi:uncharacterized protein YciI